MKKINFILLILLIFLSACSMPGSSEESDNWKDEILMAQACGEEGLACCLDKDPACTYGSCCFDPNNEENNYCAESCEFGKLDTFCRLGNICDEGMACSSGYCLECGGVGQPCCGDDECSGTSACFRGTCVECGLTGNPCCSEEPACLETGDDNLNRAECSQEICSSCGANGNPPCKSEPRCNQNHLLNNNSCYRCGGFNQPCCREVTPEETRKYCVEEGLECKLDFCSK